MPIIDWSTPVTKFQVIEMVLTLIVFSAIGYAAITYDISRCNAVQSQLNNITQNKTYVGNISIGLGNCSIVCEPLKPSG